VTPGTCSQCGGAARAEFTLFSACLLAPPGARAAGTAPPAPPTTASDDAEVQSYLQRMQALDAGLPVPANASEDASEDATTAARIAAIANGAALPAAPGGDDEESRFVERMRQHDEHLVAEARRARGAVAP